jgi:hypothetical protein
MKPMLNDKLFLRTGIETEYLDIAWGLLKLDDEPETKEMYREFEQAMELVKKEA